MKFFVFLFVLCCAQANSTPETPESVLSNLNPSTKLSPVYGRDMPQPLRDKINDTSEEIELKLEKPLSISKDQLMRFRKFLSRKGIVVKNPEDDVSVEKVLNNNLKRWEPLLIPLLLLSMEDAIVIG